MRPMELVKKVLLADLFQGFWITLKAMCSHAVTEQYPRQKAKVFDRFRGEPRMMTDEQGKTRCIACNLCALACPESCIRVEREKDPETKKFVLKEYVFDMRRCMFCGLCQETCPVDCIKLTKGFEMARYDAEGYVRDLKQLEAGVERTDYRR